MPVDKGETGFLCLHCGGQLGRQHPLEKCLEGECGKRVPNGTVPQETTKDQRTEITSRISELELLYVNRSKTQSC